MPLLYANKWDASRGNRRVGASDAPTVVDALEMFERKIRTAELIALEPAAVFCSNGPDGKVLAENCRLTQSPSLANPERFVDIRPFLSRALRRSSDPIDSCRLAEESGGSAAGRVHDALADARGVAAALRCLLRTSAPSGYGLPFS